MYKKEIEALKKANRFRQRSIYLDLLDFGSNDYLGLGEDLQIFKKTVKDLKKINHFAPKASQLVNGYTQIHKNFEELLCKKNRYQNGIVVGSGFLANLAMFEALPRKKDLLLIDEEYHASGVLSSKLTDSKVEFFKHNDAQDLRTKLQKSSENRKFVAIEGVYSMGGDLANLDLIQTAKEFDCITIIDEAHSSGVIGKNLGGILDYYNITPDESFIQMGTLGKAYGSYGAYILASNEIISFLENRGKSIIYATAPSLFDIRFAHNSAKKIIKKCDLFSKKIIKNQTIAQDILGITTKSLILPVPVKTPKLAIELQKKILKKGFFVGAIRPPTVKESILRVILRINEPKLKELLFFIKDELAKEN